jgi:hypothetical protein
VRDNVARLVVARVGNGLTFGTTEETIRCLHGKAIPQTVKSNVKIVFERLPNKSLVSKVSALQKKALPKPAPAAAASPRFGQYGRSWEQHVENESKEHNGYLFADEKGSR